MRLVVTIAVATLAACSGSSGVRPGPPADDGVRSQPLTVEEAARILGSRSSELSQCYGYERLNMNLPEGADYVAQVFVPNDGSQPVVEMVAVAVPGHQTLEDCLLRALATTRFPAHVGEPFTINVPIKAPR